MIEQFTVRKLRGRGRDQWVLVLQSHLLEGVDTVLVAPLVFAPRPLPAGIAVTLHVQGQELQAALNQMASVPREQLGPAIKAAKDQEDEIRRGLERLFTGF